METSGTKKNISKDVLLYLPAKILEGIIGIATIKIYTNLLDPGKYGNYNLLTISSNILCLLFLGWIIQSSFRYVNSALEDRQESAFYSTVFISSFLLCTILMFVGLIIAIIFKFLGNWKLFELFLLGSFMFFTYSISQVVFGLLGATRKIALNLGLSIVSVSFKLVLTLILVQILGKNIVSLVLSFVSIDIFIISFILIKTEIIKHIRFTSFSKVYLRQFLNYGIPLLGASLTISLLNVSDRYIISFAKGETLQGIYSANYSIASAIMTMIMVAVMRGVYPSILKAFKNSTREETESLLSTGVRYFLLIALPCVIGLSILSKSISLLFLNIDYKSGSPVIIFVSFGMLFYGLTEYSNKAWELGSNTSKIFTFSSAAAIVNIVINVIFIPIYGFMAAAVSTLISYIIYFILSTIAGRKVLRWKLSSATWIRIILSNGLMALVVLIAISKIPLSVLNILIITCLGAVTYLLVLILSGELKSEIDYVLKSKKLFNRT